MKSIEGILKSPAWLVGAAALALMACAGERHTTYAARSSAGNPEAANTQANAQGGLTAADQSNAPGDREITRRIRRAVVGDSRLSLAAHNVKIITIDGRVTLRGPVDSPGERLIVARYARDIAGSGHVANQLEVR